MSKEIYLKDPATHRGNYTHPRHLLMPGTQYIAKLLLSLYSAVRNPQHLPNTQIIVAQSI